MTARRSAREWLSEELEYVMLGLLLAAVIAGIVWWTAFKDDGASPRAAAPSGQQLQTCEQAKITPETDREGTCATRTTDLTVVNGDHELAIGDLRLQVESAALIPATTASGRRRHRARVELQMNVTNNSDDPLEVSGMTYISAVGLRTPPDRLADKLEGALKVGEPIPPGQSRSGTVRYELGGVAGSVVLRRKRAELGVRPPVAEGTRPRLGVVRMDFSN